jgi:hypothetical protein
MRVSYRRIYDASRSFLCLESIVEYDPAERSCEGSLRRDRASSLGRIVAAIIPFPGEVYNTNQDALGACWLPLFGDCPDEARQLSCNHGGYHCPQLT